ncbi:hypothetical protein BEV13_02350 [Rickettsiella grylli]|uniref:gamma-glutamylcyclotransferase n=1 Tax=Rickettsiella grylli TaxID=59196 RepID=UPI0008FD240C|nr:gamma-glutamylcyclotransferase [Rickettsiella grylli]OJA00800.1 hypothetical protein BEV13_02350 [Rickettsiella grylli]
MLKWDTRQYFTFILFLFLFRNSYALGNDVCHPIVNNNQQHYIIAYGSLIETNSKNTTAQDSGVNQPVWVDNYQRGWLSKGLSSSLSTTYLAVIKNKKSRFNGTIFHVSNTHAFKNFDAREKYYCRVSVPARNVHLLNGKKLPQGHFWIYELKPEFLASPSSHYPIVQSYVDIFLSGCLEIEKKYHLKHFAMHCIKTTTDWSNHWVNDRIYPRRPWVHQPHALKIDALLEQQIPYFFQHIKIES